jgi:hypothetical protein
MSPPIKLRADDVEDLRVIAACLQDAIVPIAEMAFLPEQTRFVMVTNRFMWEAAGLGGGQAPVPYQRTNSVFSVLGVSQVRRRNLDLMDRGLVLNLLTVLSDAEGLTLVFAGRSSIQLVANPWRCFVEDIGEPWSTGAIPSHRFEDDEEA